ncbi:uncharacterized protein LOC132277543 [Cornus florida]|uniref:uncharacterized protein LOC132277543 n=1 Tax=Cornus florida TaxID=4283 RepID=UPI00289A6337|nr:uncharacterized protein LOC132277543 [Cornus florida]
MHTALRELGPCGWYFDSGCSRHMTGDRTLFTTFKECSVGTVTFGDGNAATESGKSKIKFSNIEELKNVLYVKGLTVNLLSISQIYPSLMCFSAVTDEAVLWHKRLGHGYRINQIRSNNGGERKEPTIHKEERVENLDGEGEEVKEDEDEELEVTTDEPIGIPAPSLDIPTSSNSRV